MLNHDFFWKECCRLAKVIRVDEKHIKGKVLLRHYQNVSKLSEKEFTAIIEKIANKWTFPGSFPMAGNFLELVPVSQEKKQIFKEPNYYQEKDVPGTLTGVDFAAGIKVLRKDLKKEFDI